MSVSAGAVLAADQPRHYVDHIVVGVNKLPFGMSQLKRLLHLEK